MNTIRIPFAMERLNNNGGLNNGFNTDYFQRLRGAVGYVTSKGAYAVLDAHNSFRYNGRQINNNNEFQNFWNRLAGEFRNDPRVIFEVMNSPDGVSASQAADLNQAAINGIRNAGATSQLIIVEGSQRSLAAGWNNSGNANAFNRIRDPNNNFAIGFRTFFDQDGSGREASCFSASVGADRLKVATDWLNNQRFKGFLVEFGAGPNS
jgi:endoglucanase